MKMAKSGKLKTIIEEKNGKDIMYILLDERIEEEVKGGIVPLTERESATIKEELKQLREEIMKLKNDIEVLNKVIK